jgi:Putative transposase
MVEVAAHLTDHVLPPLPVRQWVLSLPKRIRPFLPYDPRLAGDVLRVLLRAIRTTLRRASLPAPADAQLGAVSFLHRFGSALNPHFHFHVVVLDGVFAEGAGGSVTFHEATHLTADDILRLERTLQHRVLHLFQRRGLLDEHTVEDMLTWQASGGFSLDAGVRIHGSDSAGRERLLRYCARPPFALERMRIERHAGTHGPAVHGQRSASASPGEAAIHQILYHPARPTRDGRTVLALSPLEFLAALSRLVPPPRVHRHRYHGVLAPNARLRERVINLGCHDAEAPDDANSSPALPPEAGTARGSAADLPDSLQRAAARSRWARLLARIYEVFPLACPDCGTDMRILTFITAAEPVDAILSHLGLPTTPPPLSPARGPPQPALAFDADPDLDLDQTPAYDLTEPEPIPDFDFDQSTDA